MFIRPGRVSTRRVDDAVDRVRAEKIPRVHRLTAVEWIARQASGIDRLESAIKGPVRAAAVELRLIEVHALFVLRRRAVGDPRRTWTGEHAVAGVVKRRRQHAI